MDNKSLDIKEKIIATTKELIKAKGNATIKEIADAAYINIAAINYHFGSKDNLIQIVIEDVVKELRAHIVAEIGEKSPLSHDFDDIFKSLISIIYAFAEENAGIINFSFLQMASQSKAKNVLIELFILDKDFINTVVTNLAIATPNASMESLLSKYIIMFSSFVVPFFLGFSLDPSMIEQQYNDFFIAFREPYFAELKKLFLS